MIGDACARLFATHNKYDNLICQAVPQSLSPLPRCVSAQKNSVSRKPKFLVSTRLTGSETLR